MEFSSFSEEEIDKKLLTAQRSLSEKWKLLNQFQRGHDGLLREALIILLIVFFRVNA